MTTKSTTAKRLIAVAAATGLAACASVVNRDLSGMSFSAEPLLGKVIWHDLITEDIDAAKTFYAGMFGWAFEDGAGPGRDGYVLARAGNVYVAGLVPIAAPQECARCVERPGCGPLKPIADA